MTTPLDYFTQRWNERLASLHLVNPSNMHVDTKSLPDEWAGVLVNAEEFRNLTMGSRPWREERGTFIVGIFTRAGEGFPGTDTLARNVREVFMDWVTDDNVLRVEAVSGPLDIEPIAEDGWHQLALELHYQAWTQPEPSP